MSRRAIKNTVHIQYTALRVAPNSKRNKNVHGFVHCIVVQAMYLHPQVAQMLLGEQNASSVFHYRIPHKCKTIALLICSLFNSCSLLEYYYSLPYPGFLHLHMSY